LADREGLLVNTGDRARSSPWGESTSFLAGRLATTLGGLALALLSSLFTGIDVPNDRSTVSPAASSDTVSVIETSTNTVVKTVTVGNEPSGVAIN